MDDDREQSVALTCRLGADDREVVPERLVDRAMTRDEALAMHGANAIGDVTPDDPPA